MSLILVFIMYRMLFVLGGILCIYLGYRLFYVVQDKQGEFKVKYGSDVELRLSEVAPGIFFAVCGTAILAASLIYKMDVKEDIMPLAIITVNGFGYYDKPAKDDETIKPCDQHQLTPEHSMPKQQAQPTEFRLQN